MSCGGKVAIVTGAAGKGMGRSIALTLAREGASVVINYLSGADKADAMVSHIVGQGGQAILFQADINELDQCRAMYEAAVREFGKVDICIVNPGAGWHDEPIENLDVPGALDDLNREIAPLYNLISLVVPGMYERKWGRIIGISLDLQAPSPAYAYDAAKAARTGALRRAAREAWQHGVTVNIIAPGPVAAINRSNTAIELCEHGKKWTGRRNVTPQDIAEGVAWLCSESANFITGCELPYSYY